MTIEYENVCNHTLTGFPDMAQTSGRTDKIQSSFPKRTDLFKMQETQPCHVYGRKFLRLENTHHTGKLSTMAETHHRGSTRQGSSLCQTMVGKTIQKPTN